MKNTQGSQLAWESLQEICPTMQDGECVYLKQDLFSVIGLVFHDTEADKELWEARILADGTCYFARCPSEAKAQKYVERRLARILKACKEEVVVPTLYESRSDLENILIFLLATIDPGEQILYVAEYHKVWVAVCYSPASGLIQDYTLRYDSAGIPYCSHAEDFSGQYSAAFKIRNHIHIHMPHR